VKDLSANKEFTPSEAIGYLKKFRLKSFCPILFATLRRPSAGDFPPER
jgi:hypothetical protein